MGFFKKNKIFVIAEMANSHEGKLSLAKKITENAAKAGADAVKFQKFTANELAEPTHEYYSLYKRLEMTNKEWSELINFAKKKSLKVFVDVFGIQSIKSLSKLNIDGYKIHSADLSNPNLLQFLAKTQKAILLSAAGSLPNEIDEAIKILSKTPKEIVIMHGFQGYPTKLSDSNLLRIKTLKAKYDLPIGLMDHISGDSPMSMSIPLIGIGLGATIIEKHLTLDRSKKGLDYYSALNPDEFKKLVTVIRKTTISLGISDLSLSTNETKYRLNHKKNPISKTRIRKGTTFPTLVKSGPMPIYIKEKRYLTYEEGARLQSLKPGFKFVNDSSAMKQLGNGVNVQVIELMMRGALKQIFPDKFTEQVENNKDDEEIEEIDEELGEDEQ